MGISGRDLALLTARFGCARFGASRFGFCPEDVIGAIGDEPGEYRWDEETPTPATAWDLGAECEGSICGWRVGGIGGTIRANNDSTAADVDLINPATGAVILNVSATLLTAPLEWPCFWGYSIPSVAPGTYDMEAHATRPGGAPDDYEAGIVVVAGAITTQNFNCEAVG